MNEQPGHYGYYQARAPSQTLEPPLIPGQQQQPLPVQEHQQQQAHAQANSHSQPHAQLQMQIPGRQQPPQPPRYYSYDQHQQQQQQPLYYPQYQSQQHTQYAHYQQPLQSQHPTTQHYAVPPPLPQQQRLQPQRPKLTTTFWEDEGTVCYQVEARGIAVSRREDTNFINGTKLLNVAGMTRGRRDGILKSEKVRYVVKIGAMNLKGVWIPFERALELARNESIVDLLYPLFVKDIKELYQGPQYSGGLTAAANSNPKNIVPVTVTSSGYTPGAHATGKLQTTPPRMQLAVPLSVQQQQHHPQQQQHDYAYGYPYQDQYPKGYYNYQEEKK